MSNLQDFLEMKKYYLDVIKEKDKRIAELEQELAELKQTYNKANEKLKNITEELENNFVDGQELNDLREEKDKLIYELEKELAELKEKAIDRPKFKHFEEYWYIENNPYCDNELQVFNGKVMEIICAYDEDWLYEYRFDTSCRYIEEDNIFATEQEALEKLKEIQGNE